MRLSEKHERYFITSLFTLYFLAWVYLMLLPLPEPLPAQGLYVDENALAATTANDRTALPQTRDLWLNVEKQLAAAPNLSDHYIATMSSFGLETSVFTYQHPASNFTTHISYAILRGHRNDNREALALVANYEAETHTSRKGLSGLGLMIAFASHILEQRWLAKNVIFIAVESRANSLLAEEALEAWVATYMGTFQRTEFRRAGNILSTLVLDLPAGCHASSLSVVAASKSGLLPNLDIVSLVVKQLKDLKFSVLIADSASQPRPLRDDDSTLDRQGLGRYKGLWRFMLDSCVGPASSLHSAFVDRSMDAITISANCKGTEAQDFDTAFRLIAALLQIFRPLNNLVEKLHHSTWLYLLVSDTSFVTLNKYFYAFVLLGLPMPLMALRLLYFAPTSRFAQSITIVCLAFGLSGCVFEVIYPYSPKSFQSLL
jgi:hypothetical protein